MNRSSLFLLTGISAITVASATGAARVPGSLNFTNITSTNVVQTVAEAGGLNEKEVEYGDFDNDGDLDVAIANASADFGQRRNKLYRNDGGVLREISGAPAIPGFSGTDVSRNAFFRDYNMDGWLDIIIVNDANTGGDGGRTKLYINKQSGGVFSHFDEEGLTRLGPDTGGAACGGASFDANDDGMPDLYVGNYPGPSQDTVYFNTDDGFPQAGYFNDMTETHLPADGAYTVDVATADMNGDGSLDVLISNHSANYIYYNDNPTDGSSQGKGDFRYGPSGTSAMQNVGDAANSENAMEPADFNGDGLIDIYWTDFVSLGAGAYADRIKLNTGLTAARQAILTDFTDLPPATNRVSRKATVADLNNDGRLDVFVMVDTAGNSRPVVLRNTTVNGQLSFIDWTPASAFAPNATLAGWHAAAFDTTNDGYKDILVGAHANDHLFRNVAAPEVTEASLAGSPVRQLPAIFNAEPLVVIGNAADGPDTFQLSGVIGTTAVPAIISISLRGSADLRLEVLDTGGASLVQVDRGGAGVEEALQRNETTSVTRRIRVTQLSAGSCYSLSGDGDDDSDADLADHVLMQRCAGSATPACLLFDFDNSGAVDAADLEGFADQMAGPDVFVTTGSCDYHLEILSRNN